jgi:hypothetical protein
MRVLVKVKKAHLGIVTTLAFSQDSRSVPVLCFSWWIPHAVCHCCYFIISGPCCRLPLTQLQGSHRLHPQRVQVCRMQIFSSRLVVYLPIFWEYSKNGCLFSDRCEPVVHDTSYRTRNFCILLYAAQRRSLGNVAKVKVLFYLLISHSLPLWLSDLLPEINAYLCQS